MFIGTTLTACKDDDKSAKAKEDKSQVENPRIISNCSYVIEDQYFRIKNDYDSFSDRYRYDKFPEGEGYCKDVINLHRLITEQMKIYNFLCLSTIETLRSNSILQQDLETVRNELKSTINSTCTESKWIEITTISTSTSTSDSSTYVVVTPVAESSYHSTLPRCREYFEDIEYLNEKSRKIYFAANKLSETMTRLIDDPNAQNELSQRREFLKDTQRDYAEAIRYFINEYPSEWKCYDSKKKRQVTISTNSLASKFERLMEENLRAANAP